MEIQFGNLIYNTDTIDNHKVSYSRLTLEQLHSFDAKLLVDNDDVEEFKELFEEYKDGGILISDQEYEMDHSRFTAKIFSSSTSSAVDYKSYMIHYEECSTKKITKLEFGGQQFEPYEVSQEISHNAVVINAKVIVTSEQFEMIDQLAHSEERYFPLLRSEIDEVPIKMRFGRNLWSKKDDIIKMALVLVEKEYDNSEKHYHGFSEPELSIAIKQIKQLRAVNSRLLEVLNSNNLITSEQKEAIENELTQEELKKEHYLYDQVPDIDEWR